MRAGTGNSLTEVSDHCHQEAAILWATDCSIHTYYCTHIDLHISLFSLMYILIVVLHYLLRSWRFPALWEAVGKTSARNWCWWEATSSVWGWRKWCADICVQWHGVPTTTTTNNAAEWWQRRQQRRQQRWFNKGSRMFEPNVVAKHAPLHRSVWSWDDLRN